MPHLGGLRGRTPSMRGRRRPARVPTPILFFIAITQLASSPFIASAQYVESDDHGLHVGNTTYHRRDQSSDSREISISSFSDFCLFGPPDPFNFVWSSGLNVVSWCTKDGHGTRLIPDRTLHGVTFVKTPQYVQVSGTGDFTKINWAPGDDGGQFDSSQNTPEGASVKVDGQDVGSWVTLISADSFCFRACTGDPKFCPSQYDQLGCWFLTGNSVGGYGTWQDCQSAEGDPPGMANGKTYEQNDPDIPDPTAPALSACQPGPSVSNGQSPPPLYPWTGDPADSEIGGGTTLNPSQADEASAASTTWLSVETCQPCAQNPVAATSNGVIAEGTFSSGGVTEQVGVTQVKSDVAVAIAQTADRGATTTAPAGNDQLDRRAHDRGSKDLQGRDDTETTTKNGQCCFTTWTASVVGGTATTHAYGGGSASATSGSVPMSGSINLKGTDKPSVSSGPNASSTPHGNGTISSGNTTDTNGTEDGGNGTGGAIRAVEGVFGSVGSLGIFTIVVTLFASVGLGAVL